MNLGPASPIVAFHEEVRRTDGPDGKVPVLVGQNFYKPTDRFRDENQQLDRELRAAGVVHTFAVYPGAHMTSLWQRHATAWLRLALNRLVKPA